MSYEFGISRITASFMAGMAMLTPKYGETQPLAVQSLEEVVVTARRREESMQEVPIAISVVNDEYLRTQNISSLEDMGVHVPSFRVTNTINTNSAIISLRGQRPSEVLITLDAAVPLYFSDVVLTPTQGTNLAMYDLQNVQVLKGPQGTLFGRNSTGGAVLLTPKSPGDELGGYVEIKVGNYDLRQFEGAVDIPVSDRLKLRFAGRKLDRDGYQDNVADNALACKKCFWDEDSHGLRLSIDAAPTDNLRNLTIISHDENSMKPRLTPLRAFNRSGQLPQLFQMIHNGGLGTALNPTLQSMGFPLLPDERAIDNAIARQESRGMNGQKVETDLDGREKVENIIFINTTEYDISDNLSIKNIFGYREVDFFSAVDTDGVALPLVSSITSSIDNVTYRPEGQVTDAKQWSEEIQLMGTALSDKLEWIIGAYWMKMEGSTYHETQALGVNPNWPDTPASAIAPIFGPGVTSLWSIGQSGLPQIGTDINVVNEAYALFSEGTYFVNDRWSISAGLRQTWDNREMTTRKRTYAGQCQIFGKDGQLLSNDNCSRTVRESFSSPTWRLLASYQPLESQLFYGSLSTGYRAGGFNARGVDNLTLQPFDEETVLNYELGYKADWSLGNIDFRTNIAIFLQKYNDIQKTQDHSIGTEYGTTIVNAAEAEIKGGELELTIIPNINLELSLTYSFVDADYKEWVVPTLSSSSVGAISVDYVDNSNADFTFIPKHSLTGQVIYRVPTAPGIGNVSFMASVYWQDEMTTDDSYRNWSSLGWQNDDLEKALSWSKLDSYAVWNIRMDWRNVMESNFDFAIYSNNVSNKKYQLSARSIVQEMGFIQSVEGAPRTFGASLRYSF